MQYLLMYQQYEGAHVSSDQSPDLRPYYTHHSSKDTHQYVHVDVSSDYCGF
jgi:hypothetical protein